MRKARVYTEEFKHDAVARMEAGEATKKIAEELELATSLLVGWRKKAQAGKSLAPIRRAYDDDFKRKAVARLVNETRKDIAADLGLHQSLLTEWKKRFEGKLVNPSHHPTKKALAKKTKYMRREYTPQFKAKAVARVKKGETRQAVADSLGIHGGMLSHWVRGLDGAPVVKGAPTTPAAQKKYYVKVKDRPNPPLFSKAVPPDPNRRALAIQSCISMLKRLQPQFNTSDVVHLTAALVLATLEGKM